jgi:hypothetical protein
MIKVKIITAPVKSEKQQGKTIWGKTIRALALQKEV